MKHILFPTDFTEISDNAFVYALNLAAKTGATITALHTYALPKIKGAANLPRTMQEVYESIKVEEFKSFQDKIPHLTKIAAEQGLTEVPVQHVIKSGELVRTIILNARDLEADLIVMGTSGSSGFKEILVGSNAGEVLENAYCPVLVVPEDAKFDGQFDRIAVTTSFKEEEKEALKWVLDFASDFGAEVTCVHVDVAHTEEFNHRMDQWSADFKDYPMLKFEVINGNDLLTTLTNYLEEKEMDLLTMLTHRRSFWEEIFIYSKTKKMVYYANTPILALQAHIMNA